MTQRLFPNDYQNLDTSLAKVDITSVVNMYFPVSHLDLV